MQYRWSVVLDKGQIVENDEIFNSKQDAEIDAKHWLKINGEDKKPYKLHIKTVEYSTPLGKPKLHFYPTEEQMKLSEKVVYPGDDW